MKIAVLLTGNELMTGDTIDSNSSMIAKALKPKGFDIDCKITVGDNVDQLVDTMAMLAERYAVVIVNGGLGPTQDDLTAEALARLSGEALVEHVEARDHLEQWCGERKIAVNRANLKQALLPGSADVIPNPIGSAVGIALTYDNSHFLCTPGVPGELRKMLDPVTELLLDHFPQSRSIAVRRLCVFGIGESSLQELIDDRIPDWPEEVTLGFRVRMPLIELKLEADDEQHYAQQRWCEQQLRAVLGESIVGENDDTMADALVGALKNSGKTFVTAESCTGGAIAAAVTSIAGASAVFQAGFVTYSDAMKSEMLGVQKSLLDTHGAVSEPVVRAMALGALSRSDADCAVAVSGVAGPSGGTPEKPVGTVWIAWGSADDLRAKKFMLPLSRTMFQSLVTALALDLARRHILNVSQEVDYFSSRK